MKHTTMKQIINTTIITAISFLGLGVLSGIFLPSVAFASAEQDVCASIGGKWDAGECTTPGSTSVESAVNDIVDILSVIVGVVSVIMIMVGGFKYVTSNGDAAAAKSARSTVIYAIVGLIVVALAQAIVWFVLQSSIATPTP